MGTKLSAHFKDIAYARMQQYWLFSKKLAWEYELKAREWLKAHGPGIRERALQYSLLMRLEKPIGTLLLLWPTLWALFIATDLIASATAGKTWPERLRLNSNFRQEFPL